MMPDKRSKAADDATRRAYNASNAAKTAGVSAKLHIEAGARHTEAATAHRLAGGEGRRPEVAGIHAQAVGEHENAARTHMREAVRLQAANKEGASLKTHAEHEGPARVAAAAGASAELHHSSALTHARNETNVAHAATQRAESLKRGSVEAATAHRAAAQAHLAAADAHNRAASRHLDPTGSGRTTPIHMIHPTNAAGIKEHSAVMRSHQDQAAYHQRMGSVMSGYKSKTKGDSGWARWREKHGKG